MRKKFSTVFFAIIMILALFTGCGKEDSPEDALAEIRSAFAERDIDDLTMRVDMENFFAQTYDELTLQLANNYEKYKTKYPNDPYFQHDSEFLKKYNAEHRDRHLAFLNSVQDAYFSRMPEPDEPRKNPYAYLANEFEKVRLSSTIKVKDKKIEGNHATLVVDVKGDNSLRGQLIGHMTFNLGFEKGENGKWHFVRVENFDELADTLVDKAELIWVTFY